MKFYRVINTRTNVFHWSKSGLLARCFGNVRPLCGLRGEYIAKPRTNTETDVCIRCERAHVKAGGRP